MKDCHIDWDTDFFFLSFDAGGFVDVRIQLIVGHRTVLYTKC